MIFGWSSEGGHGEGADRFRKSSVGERKHDDKSTKGGTFVVVASEILRKNHFWQSLKFTSIYGTSRIKRVCLFFFSLYFFRCCCKVLFIFFFIRDEQHLERVELK